MIRWQTGKEIHLDIEHSKNYEHTVALVKTCFVSESDLRAVVDDMEAHFLPIRGINVKVYPYAKRMMEALERELWGDENK